MVRRVWQLAAFVLAFATEPHAAGTIPSAPPFAISWSTTSALVPVGRCYPSGIRVLAEHDPRQPLVAVTMMVGNGSGADPKGLGGLAHLAEHMWFRAQPGGGPSIEDRLASMGATTNAYTMQDVVMFETVVSRDHLEDVLKLEALRFGLDRAAWTEDMLATERQIIAQEMRDRHARTWVVDAVQAQLFPAPHPYGAAADQALDSATLDDVARWWTEQSRPDSATLLVRGDWPPYQVHALAATVLPLADETAGACAARNDTGVTLPEPAPVQRHAPRTAPVDSRAVLIAWSLPPAYRNDDWAMRGVAQRIQTQIATKLYENFNWSSARRMSPTCEWWPGALGSTLTCVVPLLWGQRPAEWFRMVTTRLEDVTAPSLQVLAEYDAWSTELARFDDIGSAVRSRGVLSTLEPSVGDLVFETDLLAHFAGVQDPVDRRIRTALKGSADVSAIMRTYVTRERAVWVELVPQKGEETMPALDSLAVNIAAPATDTFGSSATVAAPRLGEVRDFRLDNGLRVIAVPFGVAPIVYVALVDGGPSLSASADLAHMTFDFAADVPQVEGKYGLSDAAVAARKIGANLGSGFVDGRPSYAVESSSDNLTEALYLVRIAGPESRIATDGARFWNKEVKKQEPGPAATESYRGLEALVGSEAARSVLGVVTAVDQDALVLQHQQWHRPESSTLYVVGKIGSDVEQQVKRAFGGWTAPAIAKTSDTFTPPVTLPKLPGASTVVVDGEGRASVSVACRLPQYSFAERSVLEHAVRDATYRDARERQGLVYTPSVGALDLGDDVPATLLVVAGSTDAGTAGPLLEALESSITPTASGWWERARGEASVERSLQIHGLAGLTEALASGEVQLDGTVRWAIDDSRANAIRADLESCRGTRFAIVIGPRDAVEKSLRDVDIAVRVAE